MTAQHRDPGPTRGSDRTLMKLGAVLTMDAGRRILSGGGIVVNGSTIERVLSAEELPTMSGFAGNVMEAGRMTAIPGFVQTHIHLCQTLFRGLAEGLDLLDWLRLKIFPFEAAHDASSMYASARLGIAELLSSGTTTIMDMGSIDHEEEVLRAIEESGIRAFAGKAMMDLNDVHPALSEPTARALSSTLRQAEQWHNSAGGRIRYAVAPRFILSCTDGLMREAYAMTGSFPGMLLHTHAAESNREGEAVRARCRKGTVEFLDSIGVVHANTCLAHCIWLSAHEMDVLAERKAKVLHCPSSNLKLGSGIAQVPELLERGITVSLGADGAPCNNALDMFREMRLASLLQKPRRGPEAMPALTVLEMATRSGADALGLGEEIGSIEAGKKADLVMLDLEDLWDPDRGAPPVDPYTAIVFGASRANVRSVMVDGRWVFRDAALVTLDREQITRSARRELRGLLGRVTR